MNVFSSIRIVCAVALVAVTTSPSAAQTSRSALEFDPTSHKYLGTESACRRCHEGGASEADRRAGITDRVKLNEWKTWNEQDKHSDAFKVLTDQRGQRMRELMNKNVLAESTGCIQCHTSNVDLTLWDSKCNPDTIENNTCIAEGVGCESCHGPASDWVGPHALGDWWKKTDREKAATGFRPIRDPQYRSELCLSCHVGNPSENKVITHEMYAAGHPPLSGFEMESFANKMPRHWRQSYEKNPQAEPTFDRTRNMLLANVVSLRMSMELAAADARQGGNSWPELARLECYSCHHELRLPSWRQTRSTGGIVSRPRLNFGCEPLVRVAARVVLEPGEPNPKETSQADLLFQRIGTEVFSRNIFGDPAALVRLEPIVRQWCLDVEAKLMATNFTTPQVVEILNEIYEVAGGELRDYDTSRQLAGAIIILCDELAVLEPTHAASPRLSSQLELLRQGFNLDVDMRERVEATLKQSLGRRAGFKPEVFDRLISSLKRYSSE